MLKTQGMGQQYTVSFYTTIGRKIFETAINGPGNTLISLPWTPRGAFVLECRGAKNSLVKQLVSW